MMVWYRKAEKGQGDSRAGELKPVGSVVEVKTMSSNVLDRMYYGVRVHTSYKKQKKDSWYTNRYRIAVKTKITLSTLKDFD